MTQDPVAFAKALKSLSYYALRGFADMVQTLSLKLEYPKQDHPTGDFGILVRPATANEEVKLLDPMWMVLKFTNEDFLRSVNALLVDSGIKFRRIVTTVTVVDL